MKRGVPALVAGLVLLLAGCATVPVQAMSNARQALQAAARAGAEQKAPALYADARHWLDDARYALQAKDYGHARASAKRATRLARKAAAKARAVKARDSTSAPSPATAGP